jgi:hypothetical protein
MATEATAMAFTVRALQPFTFSCTVTIISFIIIIYKLKGKVAESGL